MQQERERFCPSLSTCLFFFSPLGFSVRQWGAESPLRDGAGGSHASGPRRTHKSAGAGLGPGGRGAGQSVPARGSLTWRGQGSLGAVWSRTGPSGTQPEPSCACAVRCGEGARAVFRQSSVPFQPPPKKWWNTEGGAEPGPTQPIKVTVSPTRAVHRGQSPRGYQGTPPGRRPRLSHHQTGMEETDRGSRASPSPLQR